MRSCAYIIRIGFLCVYRSMVCYHDAILLVEYYEVATGLHDGRYGYRDGGWPGYNVATLLVNYQPMASHLHKKQCLGKRTASSLFSYKVAKTRRRQIHVRRRHLKFDVATARLFKTYLKETSHIQLQSKKLRIHRTGNFVLRLLMDMYRSLREDVSGSKVK